MAVEPFTPCEVILPVTLLHFRATCNGSFSHLEWATATEHNSAAFEVERSTDLLAWTTIGTMPAAGYSLQTVHYHFMDDQPPLTPIRYYRLRQVDLDGSASILPTVPLGLCGAGEQGMLVYPNPAHDLLWAQIPAMEENHWLELSEVTGRIVRQMHFGPSALPRTETLHLSGLAGGIYHLSLSDEQRDRHAWTKILIR